MSPSFEYNDVCIFLHAHGWLLKWHVLCCRCFITKLCPTLQHHELQPTSLLCPRNFPGKNTGVGCHFLLQGILSTQGLNHHLLHGRRILYHWAIWQAQNVSHPNVLIATWGTSLVIQWLRLHFPMQGVPVQYRGELRSTCLVTKKRHKTEAVL